MSVSSLPETVSAGGWSPNAGTVPIEDRRFAAAGYVIVDQRRAVIASQFRNARQSMLEALNGVDAQGVSLISISSAVPGEGKSFISLNLAFSLAADRKTRVTLVDFDLMRPRMTSLFGCNSKIGLTDALSASRLLNDAAYRTDIPNFTFIPIGSKPRADLELLSGRAVDGMVSSIRTLRGPHIFIFDCPPMLANEDARYLAQRSDLTVMVVKADATPRRWTLDALEKVGTRARVAMLLNNHVGSVAEQHYGYGETIKGYLDSE
jgi:protein-tyrosine kinase